MENLSQTSLNVSRNTPLLQTRVEAVNEFMTTQERKQLGRPDAAEAGRSARSRREFCSNQSSSLNAA